MRPTAAWQNNLLSSSPLSHTNVLVFASGDDESYTDPETFSQKIYDANAWHRLNQKSNNNLDERAPKNFVRNIDIIIRQKIFDMKNLLRKVGGGGLLFHKLFKELYQFLKFHKLI